MLRAMNKRVKYEGIMSADEFEARAATIRPPSGHVSDEVIDRARRVLVDGESVLSVAASTGVGKERVYETIKKKFLNTKP